MHRCDSTVQILFRKGQSGRAENEGYSPVREYITTAWRTGSGPSSFIKQVVNGIMRFVIKYITEPSNRSPLADITTEGIRHDDTHRQRRSFNLWFTLNKGRPRYIIQVDWIRKFRKLIEFYCPGCLWYFETSRRQWQVHENLITSFRTVFCIEKVLELLAYWTNLYLNKCSSPSVDFYRELFIKLKTFQGN